MRSERDNVTNLLRLVAVCVFVPTSTIGIALFLYPDGWHHHPLQMTAFLVLAPLSALLFIRSRSLAAKLVRDG